MMFRFRSFAVLAVAAVAASACRKQPEPEPAPMELPPTTTTTTTPATPTNPGPDTAAIAAEARRDSIARVETARNTLRQPIYFDYDADAIRPDARVALESKLPILLANPRLRLRVAGHTDDRGSDEYNLALGQRRAAAARRFLEARGVDPSRVDIVSFGEERPAMSGQNETAWAANRRDEFEIVAGGENLIVPAQ